MSKHAFWQALLFTFFIFGAGFFLGFFFENSRVNSAQTQLLNSELNILDEQVRQRTNDVFQIDCDIAKSNLFRFADSIYDESAKLEEYDGSNKFPDVLPVLHRRYDLLRTMLWVEAVDLKNKCNGSFHTLVYLYQYDDSDVGISSKQLYYSRLLYDMKAAHPDEVILIPIAADTELASLNVLLDKHNIEEIPAIFIDEKVIINDITTFDELEKIVFKGNK